MKIRRIIPIVVLLCAVAPKPARSAAQSRIPWTDEIRPSAALRAGFGSGLHCFLAPDAVPAGVAPQTEFDRISAAFSKDTPSQDLVDRLYEFMEKYPKDPHSDQVQFWVAVTQQRRKFHNEAIKEFGFVISDFPKSSLLIPAIRAQIDSYAAVDRADKVAENYAKILTARPLDFRADARITAAYRDAVLFTADRHLQKKETDAAIALFLQLPDRTEAVTRVVQIYVANDRMDEALAMIRRLPKEDKPLAYRLTLAAYASRPGTKNLYTLLNEVLEKEPAGNATDALLLQIAAAIAAKGTEERDQVLRYLAAKCDRLKRTAHFQLCQLHKDDLARHLTFIGDYRTGNDVEQVKVLVGELHERAGNGAKAREAYWLLDSKPQAHFRVAATYYGKLAQKKDLPAGQKELTEIVRRFYSPAVSAEALSERADLEAGPMAARDVAIASLRELIERFPREGQWPIRGSFRLGDLLRAKSKPDDAIAVYERVIREYADSTSAVRRAYLEIAGCHEEKKDTLRAVATYRMVIRKYPHTAEASQAHTILEQRYNVPDVDVSDRSN